MIIFLYFLWIEDYCAYFYWWWFMEWFFMLTVAALMVKSSKVDMNIHNMVSFLGLIMWTCDFNSFPSLAWQAPAHDQTTLTKNACQIRTPWFASRFSDKWKIISKIRDMGFVCNDLNYLIHEEITKQTYGLRYTVGSINM